MPRAYSPRLSTASLAASIRALPGVARVDILPPASWRRRTLLRVTLTGRSGSGRTIYTDFTIPDARAWLAAEKGQDNA